MKYQELRGKLSGQLVVPQDADYDGQRAIYNGMIDKRPAVIVKCDKREDVIQAVNFARRNQMEVSIRSGGHNGAGLSLVDDGLVIDLSNMKEIKIDSRAETAWVQAGNTLRDIDAATHQHGLALPSGIIGTTGIGGISLGGGLGYLSRMGGLTIDNILECEVVLATGELVTAKEDSHPELFWALRGGGGNFGVVVSFKFKLVRVKNVYAGPMFWPMEKAREAMKFYDDITKNASRDLYGFFAFLTVPPAAPFPEHLWNQKVCGVVWSYTGPMDRAEEVFKPIRAFGPPILDFVSEIPMPALNGMFDALYPPGLQWYWRAHFIKELSEESITTNIEFGSKLPSMHSTTHLYPVDGACHDVGPGDTAWTNRDARWSQVIVGVDPEPSNARKVSQWCKDYHTALGPHAMGGAYVNFMMDEGRDRVKESYGRNYERLVQVKSMYDPDNFFHINQNIRPGSEAVSSH